MTHLIPLSEALGPIRDVYAHLISEAVRRQDGRDRRTDPDHFALICVATDAGFVDQVSPTRWTRTDVYHVLRCDIPNWCSRQRCLWPLEVVEAMWEWFDFLAGTGRLDPTSDPLSELRALVGEGTRHPGREEWEAMRIELRDDLRDIEQGGLRGFPYEAPDDDEPPWA